MWHLAVLAERPWAGSPCNQRKVTSAQGGGTVQLQHLCGLFAQARWHVPPHMEVTEDCPENLISVSAIGSPLSDSNNHKNFFCPPSFLPCPLCSYCNSDSIHKAQSLLLPAKNCLLKRNWRFGMTVILAGLAMDLWHGLFLSRRMNTSCIVCCVLLPLPCTNNEILKNEYGIWARDNCRYWLLAEPCWEMPSSQRTTSQRTRRAVPFLWPQFH